MPVVIRLLALTCLATGLAACGGGGGDAAPSQSAPDPIAAVECDPANPATHAECGTVLLGLTDADGDFLNYTVDVVSLSLETANGRVVETLPRTTRINFTDYVDLTELVTAATVPPATYVAGTITLDYSAAEVFVEQDGEAKEAVVVDQDGNAIDQTSLEVQLSNRDRLIVTRGRPAFLQLDFDLAASHEVDVVPTPAVAVSEAFIVAEIEPVDEKSFRVRGPVTGVDVGGMAYTIALRPFRDRDGEFGSATVNTADTTEFEIDGEMFTGSAGLEALDAAGTGTPSVAFGTFDVAERSFTAERVLAGSSVPGAGRDAVFGSIIARSGNTLTVRGATFIPRDRSAHFHDDVLVEIGDGTRVFKDGHGSDSVSIADLSVGQRVTVLGNRPATTETSAESPTLFVDATDGAVRMHLTRLSGTVNEVVTGEIAIDLQAVDRRRVSIFDFAGTGVTPADDADPDNYQVATGSLVVSAFAEGKPVVAKGFPTAFGSAPPDFEGRTLIDFTEVRSKLGLGWGSEGTLAPVLSLSAEGLVIDNANPDIGSREYIKQGPVLISLTELSSGTTVVPASGRTLFSIKTPDSIRLYSDFGDFAEDLNLSLDGATPMRSMHAYGSYDATGNVFTATKVGVFLLTP